MMKKLLTLAITLFVLCSSGAYANVKPAALFSDHMVLQQTADVPVWGWADPGEAVKVSIAGTAATATADANGKWVAHLAGLKAGGPLTMTISGKNTVTISDVLVGEVWLASGQSNMDFTLSNKVKTFAGVANMDQEIANANWPQIRMFTVDLKLADTPQQDVTGHWAVCSPQTAGDMSAVAYFFARDLFQDQKVPFGIIDSTWGASSAQCWASRDALVSVPQLKPLVDDYDRTVAHYTPEKAQADYQAAIQKWKADSDVAKAAGKRAPRKPGEPRDPHQDQHNPYLLYNGMIYPVKPYGVKGVIWYQGESNGPTADEYFLIMKTLIDDWRTDWGKPDMPFLFVQLANIKPVATDPGGRSQVATIRNQQLKTLSVPNTAMAVTIDIGDVNSVHPKDKQDVGKRLALAAQALVYHENVPYSGPIYSSMSVEGSTIRIHFTHTDGGLVTKDGTAPTGFAIAGSDGKWAWADAKIDGDTVVLSSASVPAPTQARYGWADNPPVNLYNGAKLPASPFETTDN